MRNRRRRLTRLLFACLILLPVSIGIPILLISRQIRQDNLDHSLIQAVKRLDEPSVTRLLNHGANANATDTGDAPLTLVRLLMRLRARIQNEQRGSAAKNGDTALELLMNDDRNVDEHYTDSIDAIEVSLILHGADINSRGKMAETPLHEAARHGLHQTAKLVLSRGSDVNARDIEGRTPLSGADAYSTTLLIEHGADVDARDSWNQTALFGTVDISVVEILLRHGANVNPTDTKGLSLLYYVKSCPLQSVQAEILPLLKQHGARLNSEDRKMIAAGPSDNP